MEKFSVLISVYYREKGAFLHTALDSVFNQTAQPDEVILVKDGHLNDELDAVVDDFTARYDILKVISLPENVGLGNALQEGLKHCSYDLVARMDSDDICVVNRFELQLKAFCQHPEVSVVGGWIEEFSNDPAVIESSRQLPENNVEIVVFARSKCPMNHVTVMFRKGDVIGSGGYQHFYLFEDYWLWVRMLYNGSKFYNVQQTLVLVRGGMAMLARRGGWKYAMSEVRLQRAFLHMGFIGLGSFIKNVTIRFTVRILPNRLRTMIYKNFLRK